MTIIIPISFYNRAFSSDFKNQKYDKTNINLEADEQGLLDPEIEEEDPSKIERTQHNYTDKRRCIKITNYVVLVSGVSISAVGFINACQEIIANPELQ